MKPPKEFKTWGLTDFTKPGEPEICTMTRPHSSADISNGMSESNIPAHLIPPVRGKPYVPSRAVIDAQAPVNREMWRACYARFYQHRCTLDERLWLDCVLSSAQPSPSDDCFRMVLGVMMRYGYNKTSSTGMPIIRGYECTWLGLKKFARAKTSTPAKADLQWHPSANTRSSAKTEKGRKRAKSLLGQPDEIIKLFKENCKRDPETKCLIWQGPCEQRATMSSGVIDIPVFGQGKLMTPRANHNARRFAFMYLRRNGQPEDLPAHLRLRQNEDCKPLCVNPTHMELY